MQELTKLITQVQGGNLEAYDQIVHRFQDATVAYGYSVLGDFHLAEDAAQEAFIEAFVCLPKLQVPFAFPGWLRRIVFKQCDRILRKRQHREMPLDTARGKVSLEYDPFQRLEEQESALQVQQAVFLLPEHEREVILLFYMGQHSQNEIADFLEVPVTTVKKRLYTARKKLKEKLIEMTKETLEEQRPSRNPRFAERVKLFAPQFSQEIDAGQSLVQSLALLAEREQNTDLRRIITQIQQDITGNGQIGTTLSEAMSKHPDAFDQNDIDAVKQGETNGNLKATLEQLSTN